MTGRAPRRRPVRTVLQVAAVAVTATVLVVAVGCGERRSEGRGPTSTEGASTVPPGDSDRWVGTGSVSVDEPAAMAQGPDGALLIGERRTGRIWSVSAAQLGEERPELVEVARLDVATEGQQGLLGLAVGADGTIYAGMTRPGPGAPRQAVVRVRPDGDHEPVWVGPAAATAAIGGRLSMLPDGRLLIALGDFLRGPADSFAVDEPYSKLLSLDPSGPPDQDPVVVSEGWNNPFAVTVGPDGAVWVADNSPGDTPERLGRGDGAGPVTDLAPPERAPSGLAVLGPGELALCGYLSGVVELVAVSPLGEVAAPSEVLSAPCRLGVVALRGGGLAVAELDEVRLLAPSD